jgi:hypothetical protein
LGRNVEHRSAAGGSADAAQSANDPPGHSHEPRRHASTCSFLERVWNTSAGRGCGARGTQQRRQRNHPWNRPDTHVRWLAHRFDPARGSGRERCRRTRRAGPRRPHGQPVPSRERGRHDRA